jgi:hypothetical protein
MPGKIAPIRAIRIGPPPGSPAAVSQEASNRRGVLIVRGLLVPSGSGQNGIQALVPSDLRCAVRRKIVPRACHVQQHVAFFQRPRAPRNGTAFIGVLAIILDFLHLTRTPVGGNPFLRGSPRFRHSGAVTALANREASEVSGQARASAGRRTSEK